MIKRLATGWAALALWVCTMVVGIFEISVLQDLVLRLYSWLASQDGLQLQRYGRSYWNSVTVGTATVMITTLLLVIFMIATGEYHYRHYGTRRSWRLFGWTVAIELAILGLAYLV